ncbi:MAG: RNA-binding transcriptional accessory protein [[Eubacterium] sulci]|jgi:RNA binding S1 domain protein|nr:RNA-binding transcriptional accessory protein [[Eubacterium] sulci]MBF1169225.1 RNA-binding transcriptional accessory protein [[Eubacterium] sulci]MBF1182060.1 RNA-binding transcriptional accessory protein [[Eubacterium] sulci]
MDIIVKLTEEFGVKKVQIEQAVKLIDEGNTVPFIARYRKDVTGGLNDEQLRAIDERLRYLRGLEERKQEVLRSIEEQGKLTDELKAEIEKAEILQRVEDLYKPFKQKKTTRAGKAKAKGLEPLALIIYMQQTKSGDVLKVAEPFVDPEKEVETAEEAIQGACDIIAEMIADNADLISEVRDRYYKHGLIETEAVDAEEKTVYDMYYGKHEAICKIPNHRVLAVNRGEKEGKLKVKVSIDADSILRLLEKEVIRQDSIFKPLLIETIEDAYKRLIAPSVEREMRNLLTERAEAEAIKVFAGNTEKLLMVPPVRGKRIISIDPGFRTGCKVAVIDETGKLLAYTTIYPTEPKCDVAGTERTLKKIIDKYKIDVIVIGNGTASRETEEVVANFLKKNSYQIQYTIVNEGGASVYSASKLASEEYPDLDVTTRGAMSLGRRLQDPLAELVKIDPKHIGVGQYQHDMNQKNLSEALGAVVEDCVNRVGVDLNTASPSLLSYVAGISSSVAKNIVAYREENGKFTDRKQLLKVAKLGPKAYEQCAGFLRISDGKEVLDSTSVHPESYEVSRILMKKIGISESDIKGGVQVIDDKIKSAYPAKTEKESVRKMAEDIGIGEFTVKDIIAELRKPGRDPREDAPPVVFRNDVRSFEDLKEGMEMSGTVRNVVDFGAFVDIGVKNDGLVHVSQLSDKFVKHPMDVVSVGDTVKVRIIGIDKERGKVSLTMKL